MEKKGTLYMIPTPIGSTAPYDVLPLSNREVIGLIDHFIVENLRSARRFLSRAEIGKPIDSLFFSELNHHTPPEEIASFIKPLLEGKDMGMISEAGVPGVADPGAEIVELCHKHSIRVVPLVGPSSILLALMASGLNGQSFAFNGYLPIKSPDRQRAIKHFERRASSEKQSQIFIETPYRNLRLMDDLLSTCQEYTRLTVASDILEPTELIKTLTIGQWRKLPRPNIDKRPTIFIFL